MEEFLNKNIEYRKRPLWHWAVICFVLGLIIYGLVYYFILSRNDKYSSSQPLEKYQPPSVSQVSPSPAAMTGEDAFILRPVDSDQVGAADLVEENGQTKVIINLIGYTEDVEQPAHIHTGVCPGIGAVKYPLTSLINGKSVTVLPVTLTQLKNELPLAINVHKSEEEISIYTVCGPLELNR